MTCRDIRENLALYSVDALSDSERRAVEAHVEVCEACARELALEQRLTEGLQDQPVPEPNADFEQRVMAAATGRSDAHGSRWTTPLVGGAVAAALAVGVLFGLQYPAGSTSDEPEAITAKAISGQASPATVNGQALGEPRQQTVQLAFHSSQALKGVTLTLELPKNVELDRFPGRQQISWQVDLQKGDNRLSLPLKVLYPGDGKLVAHLENEGRRKTFRASIPMDKEPAS